MNSVYRTTLLFAFVILGASTGVALEANIQPSNPEDITLDDSNNREAFKEFDGTASTGSIASYNWNLVGSSQSDTGPTANFTFDTNGQASNTIRLTVSNGTHSDVDEVTQVVHDVPTVSISASGSTDINAGDSLTFTASVTNSFDGPVSYSWTVDGSSVGSDSKTLTHTFDTSGTKSVQVTVTDQAGKSGTASESVSVSSSGGNNGGSSSGGGGGGGASTAASSTSKVFGNLTPGVAVDMTIAKVEQYGVKRISITVNNPAQSVEITVTKQDGKPADVSVDVAGTPYRYMDIAASNLNDSTVDTATITFDVNKSWIASNDINRSTVRLHRYNNGEWQALETRETSETSEKVEFEATTPGFSYFAISGEQNQEPVDDGGTGNESDETVTGNAGADPGDQTDGTDAPSDTGDPEGLPSWAPHVIVFLIVGIVGGVLVWQRELVTEQMAAFGKSRRDLLEERLIAATEQMKVDLDRENVSYDKGKLEERVESATRYLKMGDLDRANRMINKIESILE